MTQLVRTDSVYDNSKLAAYKTCPRSYQLRYEKDWRGAGVQMPLVFGLSWHAGQDVVWQYAKKFSQQELPQLAMAKFLETWEEQGLNPQPDLQELELMSPRTPSIAHEMYINYINTRWRMLQEAEVIAIEQPFAVPMPGLEKTWYVGRLDKAVISNGQRLILEHKTTTAYKKDGGFRSEYVNSWYMDSQCKGYQFGGSAYYDVSQVWVDAALVHKKEHNHFRFIPIAHQMPILEEWIKDTRHWIEKLESDKKDGYFPRNEGSCDGKYGQCMFLEICRTTPDSHIPKEPPPGYIVEKWEPFNLLKLDKLMGESDAGK